MGMGGSGTGGGIGGILGAIAGSFIMPGVGTAIGGMLGSGLGSLVGGAVEGQEDPRGKTNQTNPASTPAEPLNRTRNVPPPSYRHGVEPEFSFFNNFDEGGPVLPTPQFNNPLNPAGQTSMQQYFPNYAPTGPGPGGSPSWAQIAAATAPVLPPLRSGVPSLQATPFDPLTYGRTQPTPQTPAPATQQPAQPATPQMPQEPNPVDEINRLSQLIIQSPQNAAQYGARQHELMLQNPNFRNAGIGGIGGYAGYAGDYGGTAGLGNMGYGADYGADAAGFGDTGYYAEGGSVMAAPAPMTRGMGDKNLNDPPEIYQQTIQALQGRHPDPEPIIEKFIKLFGPAALNRLRMEVAANIAGQVNEDPGLSDGMSDSVPATINGQQPARLSENEHVIDAATVAALGNGSSEAGHKQLEMMKQRVRQQAYGSSQMPNKINPMQMMPR